MNRIERRVDQFYRAIRTNIFAYCRAFNFVPTWQQRVVLAAAQCGLPLYEGGAPYRCADDCEPGGHPFIAVKAGKGPGKTTVGGIFGGWRTLRASGALTIATAPTMRQTKDIWLLEFKRQLKKADPLLQKIFETSGIKVQVADNPEWGIKLVTANKVENAQGYHQVDLSVIIEEASGVEREIFQAFEETITNRSGCMLAIGNPNKRATHFFDCFNRYRTRWKCITLNAEETPTSAWFDPARNRRVADEFGIDSDVYRVAVKGEFPHADPDTVVSQELLEGCQNVDPLGLACETREGGNKAPIRQIGLDLARFGSDESVIYRRVGHATAESMIFSKKEPADVIMHAFRMQANAGWRNEETVYVVDAGGLGNGLLKIFYDHQKRVCEFHNGVPAKDPKYANRITEAWFTVARRAKLGKLHLPRDWRLVQQLATRQYHINAKGQIVIESKEDYKDRMSRLVEDGGSPDRADAFVYAHYDAVDSLEATSAGKRDAQVSRSVGMKVDALNGGGFGGLA